MQRVASWLLFPLILGGAVAFTIALMPSTGPAVAVAITQALAVFVMTAVEILHPYRREWARPRGDLGTDILHAVFSGLGMTRLTDIAVRALGISVAGFLSASVGASLWPTAWPLVAQLAIALVVAELPQYWLHRLQHERDSLWRFHAVHHSAPRLYWLNAARFHPVDIGLLYFVGYVPLVVLGCPEEVIALVALFDAVFGMLQHCNADLRLGPLNWIFSAAEPHRWHHSKTMDEANTNYGSNLIVWDLAFGTFFLPKDREPPAEIGIAALPDFPQGYLAHLAAPFRWRRLHEEARLASSGALAAKRPAHG
ncbi:MAG: sterol desaturase family protein [Deltaproteobacteria bacterium]|nr:sterol desaturase family protein [Deltaproteobacteria bacterium]